MPERFISDTSCLIFLNKIGKIDLLDKLYSTVITTKVVAREHVFPLPQWIAIENPKEKEYQSQLDESVDKGEASIMALALGKDNCIVSIDDRKARKVALRFNLKVTGTLGIIYKDKEAGHISSIKRCIKQLKTVHFRISDSNEEEILRMAGE